VAVLLATLAATVVTFSPAPVLRPARNPGQRSLRLPVSDVYERAVAIAIPSVVQIDTDKGLGSGVVLDARGNVVTNAHVVAGASRFVVTDSDGRGHAARCAACSSRTTMAVVHTDAALTPATFADSSQLRVGQLALAIGNPLSHCTP
jgi:S1-C subfamily serine protease